MALISTGVLKVYSEFHFLTVKNPRCHAVEFVKLIKGHARDYQGVRFQ